MALGREVNDRPDAVTTQERQDKVAVADVTAHEPVAAVVGQRVEVPEIAGVGELVEVDHGLIPVPQPVQDEIASDEARPARHQNHVVLLAPRL